jgi:hypothetical protein
VDPTRKTDANTLRIRIFIYDRMLRIVISDSDTLAGWRNEPFEITCCPISNCAGDRGSFPCSRIPIAGG